MPANNLTEEQQLAFMRDRHISLTANAGSGKTTVLVNKYLDILLNYKTKDDAVPKRNVLRILAITYTKVAAAEMKSRLAKKVEELTMEEIHKPNPNSHKIRILKNIRDRIQFANISTIHSFCSGLLRDFPKEANLSPNFTEISELDQAIFQDDAIERVFQNHASDSNLIELLAKYGKKDINDIISQLINSRKKLFSLIDFYQCNSNEKILKIFELRQKRLFTNFMKILENFLSSETYDDLRGIEKERFNAKYLEVLKNIENYFQTSAFNEEDLKNTCQDIFENYKVKGNKTFKSLLESNLSNEFERDQFKLLTKIRDHLRSNPPMTYDKINSYINEARFIVSLANEALLEYQKLKTAISAIDFDDMIYLAKDLLNNEVVVQKISNEYDYILVDEFQDTNIDQADIIMKICGRFKELTMMNKLFIVGDPKQSIYSFQGADVEVFNIVTELIKDENKDALKNESEKNQSLIPQFIDLEPDNALRIVNLDENQKFGDLSLSISFRMSPVIAGFVNSIFSKLMSGKRIDYEALDDNDTKQGIKYSPIVCGRKTAELLDESVDQNGESSYKQKIGTVSLLFAIKENNENSKEKDTDNSNDFELFTEEELLVRHIKYVLSDKEPCPVYDQQKECFRKPNYGDIAILVRKRSSFAKLTKALLENNIPYEVKSGVGFFQTPEIQDITQFLNFLVDNHNDYAFASVLKSPFFEFNSAEIFEIAINNGKSYYNKSLYQKFLDFAKNCDNVNLKIKCEKAINLIRELKFYASRLNISSMIYKVIHSGKYISFIANSPAGEQIKSNFDKLIAYARKFESRGFRSLYDFVVELGHLAEFSKEPEAIAKSTANVVTLTTVHGAKGAEFPIVYLFDTNYKTQINRGFIISKNSGLAYNYKEFDSLFTKQYSPTPNILIRKSLNESEIAEEIRLFYVATTRAKDHLIITSTLHRKKDGAYAKASGFAHLLLKGLNIEYDKNDFIQENKLINLDTNLEIFINNRIIKKNLIVPVKIFADHNDIYVPDEDKSTTLKKEKQIHILLDPVISIPKNKYYYPSYLTELKDDSEDFLIKRIYRFDESALSTDENENRDLALNFGSAFHELMEKIDLWVDIDGNIKEDELARNIFDISQIYQNIDAYSKIRDIARSVILSPFIQKNILYLLSSKREFQLIMPFDKHFLGGIIDCLIIRSNTEIEIWDWKTNFVNSKRDLEKFRKTYEIQLKIYSYLIFHLYKETQELTCRLLFVSSQDKTNEGNWIVSYNYKRNQIPQIENEILSLMKEPIFSY